ncbi:hypothetical protein BHE74_00014721 [Ensete ventricosum]|nr:hypothetical protein BHE74_00014721 [Ensete ventricosum]
MVEISIVTARNRSTGWYQPSCGEGRSVEGEGRRMRRRSKKTENRENLDTSTVTARYWAVLAWLRLGCGEGRRSIEGEGRRKKKEKAL